VSPAGSGAKQLLIRFCWIPLMQIITSHAVHLGTCHNTPMPAAPDCHTSLMYAVICASS
jgi:hypothetical protein